MLNVQLKMRTADHPESDGQSERTNRKVIGMLRSFVNERNTNWTEFIPIVEICINNSKQISTGYSPYYINYGYHPNFSGIFEKPSKQCNSPAVEEYIHRINQAMEVA